MAAAVTFNEILSAVEELSLEEQDTLIVILSRRLVERRRRQLIGDIREARAEYDAGLAVPTSPNEIMQEILS